MHLHVNILTSVHLHLHIFKNCFSIRGIQKPAGSHLKLLSPAQRPHPPQQRCCVLSAISSPGLASAQCPHLRRRGETPVSRQRLSENMGRLFLHEAARTSSRSSAGRGPQASHRHPREPGPAQISVLQDHRPNRGAFTCRAPTTPSKKEI